ncbi:RICIN domain-containing protein [Streptosporangium vulgare]|uniref:RICIN domain-containing protein n=1 Tax=Streptosporangium vulgare TaxID=46190 RepID=A0ABV5TUY0_9ACTN
MSTGGANAPAHGYVRLVARHSDKCLDVLNAGTADGTQVVQWTCGTGTNQQWLRTPGVIMSESENPRNGQRKGPREPARRSPATVEPP